MRKTQKKTEPACEQKLYHITNNDLPLSCPMPKMTIWNAHPRVFLPIEQTGHVVCPYCGAEYKLKS